MASAVLLVASGVAYMTYFTASVVAMDNAVVRRLLVVWWCVSGLLVACVVATIVAYIRPKR